MMIRGDQHVDEWAETAVDYLDGRLDDQTRVAVEAHLSDCPECSARLRKQQYVVSVLQQTAFDDPPEDLEYRSIGELVFPSPGTEPAIRPPEEKKTYRSPRWYQTLRAWLPATVAVVALLTAISLYGVARSGQGAETSTDSGRIFSTTAAAASTTTAGAGVLSEASPAGSSDSVMTSDGMTATTGVAGSSPPTDAQVSVLEATEDPKAMVSALASAEAPTYVAFRAFVAADTAPGENLTDTTTQTTSGGGSETSAPATTEAPPTTEPTPGLLTAEQADALLAEIKQFTGLDPVERAYWIEGPTFAVYLPRQDADELVDLVRSISSSFGLMVTLEGAPPTQSQDKSDRLLEQKRSFPVLEAKRALQPSTWNYDFTTSTLEGGRSGSPGAKDLPDADGSHVIVIIWMAQ